MKVRPRVHLLNERGWFTACGRPAGTLHTDTLAAVTCWNCKVTMRARDLREAARDAEARS